MTTRKEDAESIVGEELAEELEEGAQLVGKSEAIVERTDDDEEVLEEVEEISESEPEEESVEEEAVEEEVEEVSEELVEEAKKEEKPKGEYGNVTYADKKNKKYPVDTEQHIRAAWSYINMPKNQKGYTPAEVAAIKRNIIAAWRKKIDKEGPPSAQKKGALEEMSDYERVLEVLQEIRAAIIPEPVELDALDEAYAALRAQYDEAVVLEGLTADEKLQLLQEPFEKFGEIIRSSVSEELATEVEVAHQDVVTKSELRELLEPLTDKVSLLIAQMDGGASAQAIRSATPQRRSISGQELRMKAPKDEKPNSLASIAQKSTYGHLGY